MCLDQQWGGPEASSDGTVVSPVSRSPEFAAATEQGERDRNGRHGSVASSVCRQDRGSARRRHDDFRGSDRR